MKKVELAINKLQYQPINDENHEDIQIDGKYYENIRQFDQQGCQIINFIGYSSDNLMQEIIIQTYQELKNDHLKVLEQIRKYQNQKEPKCQHIIYIIGLQDKIIISQLHNEPKTCVVIEKGQYNLLNLFDQIKSIHNIQKLKLFEQMVQGVKELQDLGYFHRYLQPNNFVFFENQNKEYKIKLIDFGLVINNNQTNKTSQNDNYNYMAPEVVKCDSKFDKTADIWSLGIILYKILTKEDLIQAKNRQEQKNQLCKLTQEWIDEYIIKTKDLKLFEQKLIKSMLQIKNTERIRLENLLKEINLQLIEQQKLDSQQKKEKKQQQVQGQDYVQDIKTQQLNQLTEQINTQSVFEHQKQINNQQEISTSINQIYEKEINIINDHLGKVQNKLNYLKQLLNQKIIENYQHIQENYDQIQKFLQDFFKSYNELYQQMQNSMKDTKPKIDQNQSQSKSQYQNLQYINELTSFYNGDNQTGMQLLQEKQIIEEQIIKKIQIDGISEQERKFQQLKNPLQNCFIQFQKAQQYFKLACEDIGCYSQMIDKRKNMEQQLQEKIKTLEEYHKIYLKNMELFQKEFDQFGKKGISQQQYEDIVRKQQQICEQKGTELCQVLNIVKKKQNELIFMPLTNPINIYEELKRQEDNFTNKLNQINQIKFDQLINPSSFNRLKQQILELTSKIDESIKNIPQNNQIQELNNIYKQYKEQYNILFGLVNYIKYYHLKRYDERIKKGQVNQQVVLNQELEVQDIFQRYLNFQFHDGNKILIETLIQDQEQINKQMNQKEDFLKSVNLNTFTQQMQDEQIINEIFNIKKYYKIIKFAQMHILYIIMKLNQHLL